MLTNSDMKTNQNNYSDLLEISDQVECGLVIIKIIGILFKSWTETCLQGTNPVICSDWVLAVATRTLADCSCIKPMLYTSLFAFNLT